MILKVLPTKNISKSEVRWGQLADQNQSFGLAQSRMIQFDIVMLTGMSQISEFLLKITLK